MSLLIFGKNGQLSKALRRSLQARGEAYHCYGSTQLDLIAQPEKAATLIQDMKPSAVINGSAFTDVNAAETQEAQANILNAKEPGIMAAACKRAGIPFIHISTDYVFGGTKDGFYTPNDKRKPLNAYGRSKAAGERAVMAAGGQSIILRTSWLYDGTGQNFMTTMLRLAKEQTEIDIVNDQFGRPTYAGHLAEACLAALSNMPNSPQIYHVTNSGPVISWADFAAAIFEHAKIHPDIHPVSAAHFPSPAARPSNSALDITAFERDFNYPLEPWDIGLKLAFQDLKR
jgi:dTDP-4-dehydrorhamnose reductase